MAYARDACSVSTNCQLFDAIIDTLPYADTRGQPSACAEDDETHKVIGGEGDGTCLWTIWGMVWDMLARIGGIALRDFDSLSEKEILALAISLEEEDERIYSDYGENLKENFPGTAQVFEEMRQEEIGHRRRLIELYQQKFGEHIPLIRRQDVRGFVFSDANESAHVNRKSDCTPCARRSNPVGGGLPSCFRVRLIARHQPVRAHRLDRPAGFLPGQHLRHCPDTRWVSLARHRIRIASLRWHSH